jgi:P27 family predicted phage terminase small subunit
LKKSTAPNHLSADAKSWWRKLQAEYDISDDAGRLLLQTALEAFDRMRGCQRAIKRDGIQVKDRFEQLKPHPLLSTERDARAQMLAALKALNFDLEPLRDKPGRPGGR